MNPFKQKKKATLTIEEHLVQLVLASAPRLISTLNEAQGNKTPLNSPKLRSFFYIACHTNENAA